MNKFILGLIFLCIFKSFSQADCTNAIVVCGNTQFNGLTVSGFGNVQELDITNVCESNENNSIWLKLNILTAGTLGFLLTPQSLDIEEDFDYYVFGPNKTCNDLGTAIRCSTTNPAASNQVDNLTGMNNIETDVSEGPGLDGNSFLKWLDVLAGESYYIVIDRPIGSSNFDFKFTGTATFNPQPTITEFPIIPDFSQKKCDLDGILDNATSFNIDNTLLVLGTQNNVNVKYYENENDAIIGTNNILNLANYSNTSNPQDIFVRITNNITGCFEKHKFTLEVNPSPILFTDEYFKCDDNVDGNDSNGKVQFDLDLVLNKIFNEDIPGDFIFKYYLNQNDANLNQNVLSQFYYNSVANQQIVILRATSTIDSCVYFINVKLTVNPLPVKLIKTLSICDTDENADGLIEFDLLNAENLFLNFNPNLTLKYFLNNAEYLLNNELSTDFINTVNPQNIIVEITNNLTACSSLSTLKLKVDLIPTIGTTAIKPNLDQLKCDLDGVLDEKTIFNLDKNNIITGLQSNVNVKYFENEQDAIDISNEIIDYTNFTNSVNPQELYVRVTNNSTGCFVTEKFEIEVFENLNFPITTSSICDDNLDGNETNGKGRFNLNQVTNEVFQNLIPNNFTFNYYLSQTDALNNNFPLGQFFNNTIPNAQKIIIKATSTDNCVFYKEINLKVNPIPTKITANIFQCDSDLIPNGISTFNLSKSDNLFLLNNTDLSLKYFLNNTEYLANNQISNLIFTNTTNPQTIIVEVFNNLTKCSSLSKLILNVNVIPNVIVQPLHVCDNILNENGINKFDLTKALITLLPSQTISYYLTSNDALLLQNEIPTNTLTSFTNTIAYESSVFIRIQDGNNCSTISELKLIVDKLPNINVLYNEPEFLCSNIPSKYLAIDADLISGNQSDYLYKWFLNGNLLLFNTYSISINQPGKYTVEVYNKLSLCFKTRTINVNSSSEATFENVLINDFQENNTITINVSGLGGIYEYSLDETDGPFQASNFFENVTIGLHKIYVLDTNECGKISKEISVLGAPKYFTPNGDGFNDFWNIQGISLTNNYNSKVKIFDKFGKLIKNFATSSQGWDGNFNNELLQSDDYWYVVELEDGRIAKGHFSLKR
jgi:gliding motility-associated-like protein